METIFLRLYEPSARRVEAKSMRGGILFGWGRSISDRFCSELGRAIVAFRELFLLLYAIFVRCLRFCMRLSGSVCSSACVFVRLR